MNTIQLATASANVRVAPRIGGALTAYAVAGVPILRPTILSVWAWTAVLVYRELTVAVFLVGPNSVTLSAAIWSFWAAGGRNQAAAVTLVMTAILAPLVIVFWWFSRRSQVRLA